MRILVLSHMYPRYEGDSYGIFVHEQVQEMKKQGLDAKVVAPVPLAPFFPKKYRALFKQPHSKVLDGIAVYYPRYLAFPKYIRFHRSGDAMRRGIAKTVQQIAEKWPFELIHAHTALPDGFAANGLRKNKHVPVVITIHGADLQQTLDLNEKAKRNVSKAMFAADKVIFISSKLERIQEKRIGLPKEKRMRIANGVQRRFLQRAENTNDPKRLTVLSVSNIIKSKGIETNIQAIAMLVKKYPNIRYQIIGAGPYLHELQSLVKNLNLQDHVEFLGKVPRKTVKHYMDRCDVFSLPSWMESFGIVYAEAMACGKPVIGCQGEGAEDFITNQETGFLIAPKNTTALVNVLDRLLANEELRVTIGAKAKAVIESRFTWEHHVSQLKRLYQELVRSE